MITWVQNVINGIHMIYSFSLYYNTDEKITALYVDVSKINIALYYTNVLSLGHLY